MHSLLELTYEYDALEPHIDARTMQIHHTKHHQSYVDKLNAALKDHPELEDASVVQLLSDLESLPAEVRTPIRNHGGGHSNHSLFFTLMAPGGGNEPTGELKTSIERNWGSYEAFQKEFKQAALGRFGSGWAWLTLDTKGSLQVEATPNQDSPFMFGRTPLLGVDVWEHAYYLNYQNRRADYVDSWWNVVNWERVSTYYESTLESPIVD